MTRLYKVLHYPHVVLKKKSSPVEKFTADLAEFITTLIDTGHAFEGGGIAAPQVGVNKRIFTVNFSPVFSLENKKFEKKEEDFLVFNDEGQMIEPIFPMVFINPEITKTSQPIVTDWEGCLSFPDVESHNIDRFHIVEIHAYDVTGKKFSVKTSHLYAAINFQHETDHLNGVLMIDRWNKKDFSEKEVISNIHNFEDQPCERKKMKKLKLIDANKIKFDFL